MFLFLSKLLPLFIYPLGIACILLIIALIMWLQRSRWIALPIFLALVVLLISSNARVSNYLIKTLEWQNLPSQDLPTAEAIVVLGGATRAADAPRIMPDINENGDRLLYAAKLYQEQKAPLVILAGGRIEWYGAGQPEAVDMKQLLQLMGVPAEAIILEPNSLNTYQNAVNVKEILQKRNIEKILLVTSAFHMPRSLLIFQRQNINAIPAPTDFLLSQRELEAVNSSSQSAILSLLPEAQNLEKTTKILKEYVGMVVYRLRGWL